MYGPACYDTSLPSRISIIAICQDCGTQLPVIADACQSSAKSHSMPVAKVSVEGTPVNVLRDTGCSTIVVRRALVPDDKLSGREERCILIDGTVRYTPMAEIYVETPFFSGLTTAICMKNPIYDLVVGNVPGARDVSIPQPVEQTTQAVQTRSQAKVSKGLTPLITPPIDLGTELQSEDETLRASIGVSPARQQLDLPDTQRISISHQEEPMRTGVETTGTTKRVETPHAHAGIMSGHQGVHRTQERINANFWWPGMTDDVTRFCHSCDVCQRTVSKGRVSKVPVGKMPIIDTSFKTVAIDLVGEIFPASSRGHIDTCGLCNSIPLNCCTKEDLNYCRCRSTR